VLAQQWLTRGRRYTTLTGQFQNQPHRLGRWRAPALALVLALVSIVLGVPVVFALLGTFMKLFGFFHLAHPWTLNNWKTVLTDELFLRSLHNTVVLAVGTAVAAVVVHSLIAYIAVRTRYAGRRALDFISWLPFTVPGIILGLALLWLFLGVEMLKPLYGTTTLLIVAGVIAGMPLGVQIIKSGLLQLGSELEEASRIAGASWWATYRRIVLRLMAPTLMAVAMITFVGAARNIGNFALLTTSANRPLSIYKATTSRSASSRRRSWWPASSCSSRWPVRCSPACSGSAAASDELVTVARAASVVVLVLGTLLAPLTRETQQSGKPLRADQVIQ